jgi:hypothetical protein
VYTNEIFVYQKFLPSLEAMREAANLRPLAFPKCLLASLEEEVILLQNLNTQGFVMRPKCPQGTLHILLLIEKVNRLVLVHSTTVVSSSSRLTIFL